VSFFIKQRASDIMRLLNSIKLILIVTNYEKKVTTYLGKDNETIESMQKHLSYRNYSKYTVTKSIKEMNHLCCYYQYSPKKITEAPIEYYLYYLSTVN
jgi:hypothetical protein